MAEDDAGKRREAPRFSLSRLQGMPALSHLPLPVAAAVTGLVSGAVATLLVWGGEQAATPSAVDRRAAATAS